MVALLLKPTLAGATAFADLGHALPRSRILVCSPFLGAAARKELQRSGLRQGSYHCQTSRAIVARANEYRQLRALDVRSPAQTTSSPAETVKVVVDNSSDPTYTVIKIKATNRPGLLNTITSVFRDLGLDVGKADINMPSEDSVMDSFYVNDLEGKKILGEEDQKKVQNALVNVLSAKGAIKYGRLAANRRPVSQVYELAHAPGSSDEARSKTELLHTLMDTYIQNDTLSIQKSIVDHVEYTVARGRYRFDDFEAYQAVAYSVRDRLIERWNDTQQYFKEVDPKRVYYLSMEFLMGRSLLNAVSNLGIKDQYADAVSQLGYKLETLVSQERDAALGNGGLGRLAACFLDSMATLNYPAWGYGIRYQYGMFRQSLKDGFQYEQPDYWLNFGNPWEMERAQVSYPVRFYGRVEKYHDNGRERKRWVGGEIVEALAYDNPIPGYLTANTINLRLWAAKPSSQFDLESFNTGDYVAAILSKQRAETISSVLYPDDRTYQGKELRLKQQYFFTTASLRDVMRRYKEAHSSFDAFPDKVAYQLNDTHPTIAVPELMRLLMDEEGLDWDKAWDITTKVFSFTNHTVLPEALEKWPVDLLESLLPRHLQIIYDINSQFLSKLREKNYDGAKVARLSLIEESTPKTVRMANLAIVSSHTVNGVAAIHSDLIKTTIFKDFYDYWPQKFQNKTNGVTQRRWLAFCNPGLRSLITGVLGTEDWITNLDLLTGLRAHADDAEFQEQWREVRKVNKARLAEYLKNQCGVEVSTDAMFDIQVKRIHEYKRQLMNVLSVIHRYDTIKHMSHEDRKKVVPRVCIIGGKAAPGYDMAKRIIKLISAVGDKINNDPDVGSLLKLIFVPDYNVSLAEVIIPASDISQHISTAGTEASGTSNMKFAMNGGLIIGTMDGANVEIAEEVGVENMFIFGARAHDVPRLREERVNFRPGQEFERAVNLIRSNHFGWKDFFAPIVDAITGSGADYYLLANDFPSYLEAQALADRTFQDTTKWARMSIMSTAGSGKFSSDRTIKQYADEIWHIQECKREI